MIRRLAVITLLLACHAAAAHAAPYVYVTNFNGSSVSVIDVATNTVTATIPVGAGPAGVAVSPKNHRVYVTNMTGNTVSVINSDTNTVVATIPVVEPDPYGFVEAHPYGVSVNPAGTRLYVAHNGSIDLSVIDTATNSFIKTFQTALSGDPRDIAVNPAGTFWYATAGEHSVAVISASTNTQTANIATGGPDPLFPPGPVPEGIAINPAGTRAYVALWGTRQVEVLDLVAKTSVALIPVTWPSDVAIDPAGSFVYVSNYSYTSEQIVDYPGFVTVIDAGTNKVVATIQVGKDPRGIAVTPDGAYTYVANFAANNVSVINNATRTVVATIPVGAGPRGLAIGPAPTVAPAITNGPPPNGTAGMPYNFAYTVTGTPPPTFSVTSGALPPGLTLSSTGVISGTPTTAGTCTGTVTATNGIAPNATQNFSITIAAPPAGLPTLSEWSLLVLLLSLVGIAITRLR